jgi:hypothetical protein
MIRIICTNECVFNGKIRKPGELLSVPPTGNFPKSKFKYKPHPNHPDGPDESPLPTGSGFVTILGDGPSLQKAIDNGVPGVVAAVNKAGIKYPGKIDYWLSLHPYYLALWRHRRKQAGFDVKDIKFISPRIVYNPPIFRCPDQKSGGSSGLYAVQTLEQIGFDSVQLIGIDLCGGYEIFRPMWKDYEHLLGKY